MKNRSIRSLLMKNYMICAILPTLLLSAALIATMTVQRINSFSLQAANEMELVSTMVRSQGENINYLLQHIPHVNGQGTVNPLGQLSYVIKKSTESDYAIDPEKYREFRLLKRNMTFFYFNNNYINDVILTTSNNKTISFNDYFTNPSEKFGPMAFYQRDSGSLCYVIDRNSLFPDTLFNETAYSDPKKVNHSKITFAMPVFHDRECVAVAMINCNERFFDPLSLLTSYDDAAVRVISDAGDIWYESDPAISLNAQKAFQYKPNAQAGYRLNYSQGYLTVWNHLPLWDGFTIISYIPLKVLSIIWLPVLIGVLPMMALSILFFILSIRFSNRISRPISILIDQMALKNPVNVCAKKEVSEFILLYRNYNEMLQTIDNHIRKEYDYRLIISETKIKAMESQINAHFLYNTLDIIYSLALMSGAAEVAGITQKLSNMFRYISNFNSSAVRVRDEERHLQDYLAIQRIHTNGRVVCQVDLAPDILDCMIPKLLLQPLAENAFKYGFSDRTEDGVLEIKGLRKNGLIYFTVRNNGAGMPPNQLKSVRESLMAPGYSTMGVGLPNIAQRLKLFFNSRAKIMIDSSPAEGTCVRICIPESGNVLVKGGI